MLEFFFFFFAKQKYVGVGNQVVCHEGERDVHGLGLSEKPFCQQRKEKMKREGKRGLIWNQKMVETNLNMKRRKNKRRETNRET